MYKIEWIRNKNIPILNDFANEVIIAPRPVYYEELDLLGFNSYWEYSKSESPLLWAIGRDYYYFGEKIGKTVGGDIYEAPKLEIYKDKITLEPIDIKELIRVNKKHIETLKNEAIEFVKKIYNEYKNKVDFFVVAFSGGKDSQVLLDLVTIALEPEQYKVIFTDTTMELPHTYKTVQEAQKHYQKIYKNFKITTVRNPTDADKLWGVFGPPSRILRWCCSVYKTSPVHSYLKVLNNGRHPRTILFDGVRRDESNNRANHLRVADSIKHNKVINTRPIIEWNDLEVYLYMFYSGINPNKEYRLGLNRVGCSICPFASQWSDFIINKKYPTIAKKFIPSIKEYMSNANIKNKEEYLSKGHWKKRAGGNSIETENQIKIEENKNSVEIVLENSNENIFEWLKVLGNYKINDDNSNIQIKLDKSVLDIGFEDNGINQILLTRQENISDISHLKKVAYKTNYCVHCGSCEAECPTGALNVFPKVQIDTNLCIHCSKCLDFHNKGCVMADSAHKTSELTKVKGFNDYGDFGLRELWLKSFFDRGIEWINDNQLGSKQKISIKKWFRDSELVSGKSTTELFSLLRNQNKNLQYEILFINLYYNSSLIKWYLDTIKFNDKYSSKELVEIVKNTIHLSESTIKHSINSIVNLFDTTPLGNELKIGYITKEKNVRYIQKIGSNNISYEAILYSLYKLKEHLKRDDFRVSEFYEDGFEGGPYKIFGIDKESLIKKLKFISEDTKLIDVNLIQGLDNVFLKDFTAIEVLKEVLK